MKRIILVIAALVSSTLFASAPARADATAALVQIGMGMISKISHTGQHRRPPCHIMIDGRCVQPQVARRGYHPINMYRGNVPYTYLPPNIPGSRGYTGGVQGRGQGATRNEHVTDSAKTHIAAFAVTNAPECRNQAPGTPYQRTVREPGTGRVGTANYHC